MNYLFKKRYFFKTNLNNYSDDAIEISKKIYLPQVFSLTFPAPEQLKNSIFEIPIIPQTLMTITREPQV